MSDRIVNAILVVLFSIGLGLGAVAFGLGRLDRAHEAQLASVPGTITALEHVRETPEGAPESSADVPVLHFDSTDGRTWDVRATERVPPGKYLAGDHVSVRYEIRDPRRAYIQGTRPPVMTWFAWLFAALFCGASGLAALAVRADRRRGTDVPARG